MDSAIGDKVPRRTLDSLVTQVAAELMGVDATTMVAATERVLAKLVDYFDVDFSFVRHTDRERRATVLVAEWPQRQDVPDPDPLRVVYFEQADSVFRAVEHATEPMIARPTPEFLRLSGDDSPFRTERCDDRDRSADVAR